MGASHLISLLSFISLSIIRTKRWSFREGAMLKERVFNNGFVGIDRQRLVLGVEERFLTDDFCSQ